MIVPLFLDTVFHQDFPKAVRAAIREVCVATEPEVRVLLPALTETIKLTVQTGRHVIPHTGEVGMAVAPGRVKWSVDPSDIESPIEPGKRQNHPRLGYGCPSARGVPNA